MGPRVVACSQSAESPAVTRSILVVSIPCPLHVLYRAEPRMDRNFLMFMATSMLILVVWQTFLAPEPAVEPPVEEAPAQSQPVDLEPSDPDRDPVAPRGSSNSLEISDTSDDIPARSVEKIRISSARWDAVFTSRGGGLESFELRDFVDKTLPDEPRMDMVTRGDEWDLALATPLRGLGHGDLSKLDYDVSRPDPNTLIFERTLRDITVRKTFLFEPDSYRFRLRIEVGNGTDHHLSPNFATVWPARAREGADFVEFNLGVYTNDALEMYVIVPPPALLFGGSGSADTQQYTGVEWVGAHTRYFLAAIVPDLPEKAQVQFLPVEPDREAVAKIKFNQDEIPPNGRLDREYQIYLGPKQTAELEAVGAHLDEAILKGWFPPLTVFFASALKTVEGVVGNYGVAIILITILVRILMAPLMTRQMKSMKRISAMQPEIKAVQEKFADDKTKQSEEMMAVYKKHDLSPFSMFSGCLPMFLQFPVFIGFYYALQGSILLRQQPFVGWMDDLSQPEALFTIPGIDLPVRLLPLMMGGAMFLQQKLAPQTAMDPAQARMMLWMMPIMFTVLFYQFASGLVLYWFVSTLIGIGQQALTNRSKD